MRTNLTSADREVGVYYCGAVRLRWDSMKRAHGIALSLIAAGMLIVSTSVATPGEPVKEAAPPGRIFFLDLKAGRLLSANPDGADLKVLLEGHKTGMDGVAVDAAGGHIFWTNMGRMKENDG